MILTWTRCKVPDGRRDEFIRTVAGAKQFSELPGFCGQVGGWDLAHRDAACLLRSWWDEYSYKLYVDNNDGSRDSEFTAFGNTIKVDVFHSELQVSGESRQFRDWIAKAKVLRVSDCLVKMEREQNFALAEIDVLAPGIQKAKGLYGCLFNRLIGTAPRYLVTTFWNSLDAHTEYLQEIFPKLASDANLADILTVLETTLVDLQPDWVSLPTPEPAR